MHITFTTSKLAKIFNSKKKLITTYGDRQSKKIMVRMQELRVAQSLHDLGPPYQQSCRCHELKGERKGEISIDLKHPYRLLFVPNHDPIPQREEGGLDWKQVTAITIIGVVDTHG